MEGSEELLQAVKAAVRQTVAVVRERRPQEELAGYALLTDDDLGTLSYLAITKETLASGLEITTELRLAGDDLLFSPTDWPYEYEATAFDLAEQYLGATAEAGKSEGHVEQAFATLVRALVETKTEALFASDVFLSVLSTDPSPYLEELETASVERLNRVNVVQARVRFLERWRS